MKMKRVLALMLSSAMICTAVPGEILAAEEVPAEFSDNVDGGNSDTLEMTEPDVSDSDEEKIPESYWTVLSGKWDVWQDTESTVNRPYSQLEGYGQLAWNYGNFSDIHLRAQIIFPEDGGGKAGIFLGSLFCCYN